MVDKNTPGSRIRTARLHRGMSESQLAKKLGITRNAVARMEIMTRDMKISTVTRVAGVLGVPPEWIAFGEDGGRSDGVFS